MIVDAQPAALGLDYPVQFTTEVQLLTQRNPAKDEKKEETEKFNKDFAENLKKQQTKLAGEQARGRWTYLVSKWTIDSILKKRSELMVDPKKDAAADNADAISAPVGFPNLGQ